MKLVQLKYLLAIICLFLSILRHDCNCNKNKRLANPQEMRSFSDRVDDRMGWHGGYKDSSRPRGFIHGVWHYGAGVATFNKNEFRRGNQQFGKAFGRR